MQNNFRQHPGKPGNQLPATPINAVQNLIRLSQQLLTLAEKETQSLLFKDMLAFSILQYEKEKIAGQYVAASEDFRKRLEEFRGTDKHFLNRLELLQRELAEKAQSNNMMVMQIQQRAQANTDSAMDKAREFSAGRNIRLVKTESSSEGAQS